ncbi:fructose-bisphosphatase class II [Ferrimicrobium sp.]|uniref:fructose-bisphosphatase class II n=1 Tax=Ferrimicrobium sp. TaxID=2926050 RepID=UPI00260D6491|nr:fructose-bisphosphatase class II [Ferrimicrobium sp.]
MNPIDERCVTTVRMLSIDQVEAANSGHPGLPLGLAPVAYTLFARLMNFDPEDPSWPNRDRFILSAGHGSALLYSLLHLFGYDLSLEELRRFRQIGSKTPGHPEYGHTPGVETTTGPLGQGLATAVGIAIGEAKLRLGTDGSPIDHYTFVLASDGDLMEGLSHEAASLAGMLRLGHLIVGYDSNDITIDGPRQQSCTDDPIARFESYGWQVLTIKDTEDLDEIERVYREAMADQTRPSLIIAPTIIGRGAPAKEGTSKAHGAPLGAEELAATKAAYDWPTQETFLVPDDVRTYVAGIVADKQAVATTWRQEHKAWMSVTGTQSRQTPPLPTTPLATRAASALFLKSLATGPDPAPGLIGGSADLGESTGLNVGLQAITPDDFSGSAIHFGIREHAMAAVANGLALYGFTPYVSTFLVFSDYLRPSLRLSALMGLGVIYLFSHDSFAVGEDGPTHQPIEQLEALRIIPNTTVLRPADAFETFASWELALAERSRPTILALTRQPLPQLPTAEAVDWLMTNGARIVHNDPHTSPEVVLVASGSEVALAIEAAKILKAEDDVDARVISVPWRERFLALDPRDRDRFAPAGTPRLVLEASVGTGWHEFLSPGDRLYNVTNFGTSAPMAEVAAHFGFTPAEVADAALDLVVDSYRLGHPSHLVSDLLRATEAAASAALSETGLGDKNRADAAAVAAMREELERLPVSARVIVGEGEKDDAPMLYVGECLGTGTIDIDLAIDPLEGTNFAATGREGAISVIAAAPGGGFTPLPGYYLEKLIVGERAAGVVDISRPLLENVKNVASRLGLGIGETTVVILAKPRHETMIANLRGHGVPVIEIPDGDVMASLRVLRGDSGSVMLWGIGGTPEGVISAAATLALSGQMQSRFAPQSEAEAAMVKAVYPEYDTMQFEASDLAHAGSVVVATSVTGAYPLAPPKVVGDLTELESLWIQEGRYGIVRRLVP